MYNKVILLNLKINMQIKIEGSGEFFNTKATEANKLSLTELTKQFTGHMFNCGFFRFNKSKVIEGLKNNHTALIQQYREMIEMVNAQLALSQSQLNKVKQYGEDGNSLRSRILNELDRQNKYLRELESQLSITQSLAFLFNLETNALFEEAKTNKFSARLIAQTPELIAKVSNAQMEYIIHQDNEIAKLLASRLTSCEYTPEIARIYIVLRQNAVTEPDKLFIANKEDETIRNLLLKIDSYLDKKIVQAFKEKNNPWSLGYFGSRYKVKRENKPVSVPQGIYELKTHLSLLGKAPSSQILDQIKATLNTKLKDIRDDSIFKQVKRFVSYILGYHQSHSTIVEYQYLDELLSGRQIGVK